jgi:alpha-tubulin suppressor-like RCC1 family protein
MLQGGGCGGTEDSLEQTVQANTVEGTAGFGAIEAGDDHTCAIRNDGRVICWGSNGSGQLGDGTTTTQTSMSAASPVSGLTNARMIAAGGNHSCAVDGASTVWCWGENANGELGDGTTTQRTTPVATSLGAVTVVSITAGFHHTCALLSDATVRCWGQNNGQVGDNTSITRTTPVTVLYSSSGPLGGVKRIVAGDSHTCALLDGGAVWCWGFSPQNGLATSTLVASAVSGLGDVRDIVAGGAHTCVTKSDGTMWCWGFNGSGQLGDGSTLSSTTPVQVKTGTGSFLTGVVSMAAGIAHTCATLIDDSTRCWGDNFNEQVGDGASGGPTSYSFPVTVGFGAERPTAITAGFRHTCASAFGRVACWGDDSVGQIGNGAASIGNVPTPWYSDIASNIIETFFPTYSWTEQLRAVFPGPALDVGGSHACAIVGRGTVVGSSFSSNDGIRCWGENGERQLGNGDTTDRTSPTFTQLSAADVISVATGAAHTCALTRSTGDVLCWGRNSSRQAADSATNPILASTTTAVLSQQIAIAAGDNHSCSLGVDGRVLCWGLNDKGQMGHNSVGGTSGPTDPVCQIGCGSYQNSYIAISAGGRHSCGVRSDGTVWCWGDNAEGQSGRKIDTTDPTTLISEGTTQVRLNSSTVLTGAIAVTTGDRHSCALVSSGAIYCWGRANESQMLLATSSSPWYARWVTAPGDALQSSGIAAGGDTTCVLRSNGQVACWGANGSGQAGRSPFTTATTPTTILEASSPIGNGLRVGLGSASSCSMDSSGTVRCWGKNDVGQLGRGSMSPTPTNLAQPVNM